MNMDSLSKPHAVLIPFPAQGHINPFMQLAKLLHSKGFYITFINNQFNHSRLARSRGKESIQGLPNFRFEAIPDGLSPSDPNVTQYIPSLCVAARNYMLHPLRDLLVKLNSSPQLPKVTCIIPDGFMSFGLVAAEELCIPGVPFWTASACGFMAHLHTGELIKRGLIPHKRENFETDGSLEVPVGWIPGFRNARLKDMPFATRTTDPNAILLNYLRNEVQDDIRAPAIIFNTFDKLENEVLENMKTIDPHIYTIGPLPIVEKQMPETPIKFFKPSLWKEDTKCLEWLDKKEPNSVVYVNFGRIAVMSGEHFKEFAWGLANSRHPFLWIVRPDVVKGTSAILNDEYYEEIKDRALLASWCEQDKVLSHPSVGAFLTHCGWNSVMESICGGKPMICCPFLSEQPTNCRFACTVWDIGLEIKRNVKREEISALVKKMMEGEGGKRMREKAIEWKEKAEEATKVGGSSYKNCNRLVEEVLGGRKSDEHEN